MAQKEIWKVIPGYNEKYLVSNKGNVKSIFRRKDNSIKETILKPNKVAFDYLQVSLYKEGKRKCRYIHNLVMEAFVGEKLKGYEVNHIDEDKSNNDLTNLEYLTCKENNNYGTRIKRMSEANTNGKKSKKVKGTHLKTGDIVILPSISEAKRQGYGNHISDVCLGKRSQCKGYKWEFIN